VTAVVGIDGGASGVRVHLVEALATGRLRLGARRIRHHWTRLAGFEPLPLEAQLAQRDAPVPSQVEVEEGAAWVHTVANAVAEGLLGLEADGLLVGVCLPGLKTADGRGVAVLRRGPRMPAFAEELERQLAVRALPLERPITRLWDDGDAAAWGEEWAAQGVLAGVANAYVVAPGTGVAEGLKVDGAFPPLASLRDQLPAPWSTGDEDRLGMHGLHAALGGAGTIDARARRGEAAACAHLSAWSGHLGAFLAGRLAALAGLGIEVERVVVGARGGALLAEPGLAEFTRTPLEMALAERLDRPVPEGFLVPSTLRAAPAIGVAAEALGLVAPA